MRVCRETVCFTGRRDSFNFENRLARQRPNLAPARRVSSSAIVERVRGCRNRDRRVRPRLVGRPLVFSRPAPSRAKRPAPEHGTRDRAPTRRPPRPPTRSAELARAFAPRASRADGARVSAARASADFGAPTRDCVQSAPSTMPTALLMQQSGPQAGPQGQSKTVTVTITGASRAPSRGPTAPLPNPRARPPPRSLYPNRIEARSSDLGADAPSRLY